MKYKYFLAVVLCFAFLASAGLAQAQTSTTNLSQCTGYETSGPCRPELSTPDTCGVGTDMTFGTGQRVCTGFVNGQIQPINLCNGSAPSGPCLPARINKYAADAAAADASKRLGMSCHAEVLNFPGVDLNTGLNYFYSTTCGDAGTSGSNSCTATPAQTYCEFTDKVNGSKTRIPIEATGYIYGITGCPDNSLSSKYWWSSVQEVSVGATTCGSGLSSQQTSYVSSMLSIIKSMIEASKLALSKINAGQSTTGTTVSNTASFSGVVTVNASLLNVRSNPNTSATIVKQLSAGSTFSATCYAIGETVEGSNQWWRTSDNNYIWAGGTLEQPSSVNSVLCSGIVSRISTAPSARLLQIISQANVLPYGSLTPEEQSALTDYLTVNRPTLVNQNFQTFAPGSVFAWALSMGTGTTLSAEAISLGFITFNSSTQMFVKTPAASASPIFSSNASGSMYVGDSWYVLITGLNPSETVYATGGKVVNGIVPIDKTPYTANNLGILIKTGAHTTDVIGTWQLLWTRADGTILGTLNFSVQNNNTR